MNVDISGLQSLFNTGIKNPSPNSHELIENANAMNQRMLLRDVAPDVAGFLGGPNARRQSKVLRKAA